MSNSSVFRTSVGSKSVLTPDIRVAMGTTADVASYPGSDPVLALGSWPAVGLESSVGGLMELVKNPPIARSHALAQAETWLLRELELPLEGLRTDPHFFPNAPESFLVRQGVCAWDSPVPR
jgi:hypothetical protein